MKKLFQDIINNLYRHPLSKYKDKMRFGGRQAYQKMLNGQQAMKAASKSLPPITSYTNGLPIYFLTGSNYIHQTLFCIQSLANCCADKFKFILVDDGTLDAPLISRINQQLPCASIITSTQIQANLEKVIPKINFPVIHKKREVYPHLKKLTDIHSIAENEWKLVLDSDMLFWQRPDDLISWLNAPEVPIHMIDCVESYGYPTNLMQELCGEKVPQLLNVGAIGLKSGSIEWQQVEQWILELEAKEGASYYLEQALTAMLIGAKPSCVLNANKYKVNPATLIDGSTLHHYVDLSKSIYFLEAWKKIANWE
ncbi:glycosyl transferase [Mucilaginibacter pallidiroseus]|uniref:Glycosyl transferase n=1 Tax=Mucilaginibacter pallidiroseus TaxID=2599295 RepID=A0A563U257_9SPHI|nr:glycosyl transferase [Mucilaginibacter pallidiroseus]TWR25191.1 glycosyl transferase [Mucilaginibacter pallidiroseus]